MKTIAESLGVGYLFLICFCNEASQMTNALSASVAYLGSIEGLSEVTVSTTSISEPPKSVLKGPAYFRDYSNGNAVVPPDAFPAPAKDKSNDSLDSLLGSSQPKNVASAKPTLSIATPTGYLENLAASADTRSSTFYTPCTTVPAAMTKTLTRATPRFKAARYAPFGSKPKDVVATTGYLEHLSKTIDATDSSPTSDLASTTAHITTTASTSSVTPTIMTASSVESPSRYAPFGSKPKAIATPGYLGNLITIHDLVTSSESTTAAIMGPMVDVTTTCNRAKRTTRNYSPFGRKAKSATTPGYLGNLVSGDMSMMRISTFYTPAATVPTADTKVTTRKPPPEYYSPFDSDKTVSQEPIVAAFDEFLPSTTTTTTFVTAKQLASYCPFGQKPKVVATAGYLGTLDSIVLTSTVAATAIRDSIDTIASTLMPVSNTPLSPKEATSSTSSTRRVDAQALSTQMIQDISQGFMNSQKIGSILLTECEPGRRAIAAKIVSKMDGGEQDVKALAHLAGTICLNSHPGIEPGGIFVFAGVNGVQWHNPVTRGDLLVMEVDLNVNADSGLAKATGRAYVGGALAVEVGEMTFAIAKSP